MDNDKPPKFTKNGEPDNRGLAEGSKATRFAADDGRPRPGRPKKSRDMRKAIEMVRDMPAGTIKVRGRALKINSIEGILLAQRAKALKGDTRAARFFFDQASKFEPLSVDPQLIAKWLDEDMRILEAYRARGGPGFPDEGSDD